MDKKITLYMRLDRLTKKGRLTGNYRELVSIEDIDKERSQIKEHSEIDYRDGRTWVQRFLLEKEELNSNGYYKLVKRVDVTDIVQNYIKNTSFHTADTLKGEV